MDKVTVRKTIPKKFLLNIKSDGDLFSLVGLTYIRAEIKHSSGLLALYYPLKAGVNEQQKLAFSATPDSGSFKIKIGDETTEAILFDDTLVEIEDKIKALNEIVDVSVTGSFAVGFIVEFTGGSGTRAIPLMVVDSNVLKEGANDVDVTVTEEVEGSAPSGIDVPDVNRSQLEIYLSESDIDSLAIENDLDICLDIRIGSESLDIDPMSLKNVIDVSDC